MTPLTLDDPLNATQAPQAKPSAPPEEKPKEAPSPPQAPPEEKPKRAPRSTRSRGTKRRAAADRAAGTSPADAGGADDGERQVWRRWGGGTRAQTYKVPDQLIEELDARTTALNLPIGMTVAAAVVAAMDLEDDELITLVERAEEARERGRRAARRLH